VSYLLDTNVLSEIRKPQGDAGVKAWFEEVRGEELYLSVLVLGEVRQGVERLRKRDKVQAAVFERWLRGLETNYQDRILDIDTEVADRWGRLNAGDPLPVIDGLLAATALTYGLTLVTRNVKDMERSGATLFNPFEGDETNGGSQP
jgi:predicted nucleic acid-binding protein